MLCDSCELEEFQRKIDGKTNDFVIARTEGCVFFSNDCNFSNFSSEFRSMLEDRAVRLP